MRRGKSAPWVGSSQKDFARERKKCMPAIERMEKEERRGLMKYTGKCKCECGREMAATNHEGHKGEVCPFGEEDPKKGRNSFKVQGMNNMALFL